MKLAILDKSRPHGSYRWWNKEELSYAFQDKHGHWWITRSDKKSDKKTGPMFSKKRKGESSITDGRFALAVMAGALGVSLALNVIFLIWGN
jgi:hypothetical protein